MLPDRIPIRPISFGEPGVDHYNVLGIRAVFGSDPAPDDERNLHDLEIVRGRVRELAVRPGVVRGDRASYDVERTGSDLPRIEGKRFDCGRGGDSGLPGEIVHHPVDKNRLARLLTLEFVAGVVNRCSQNTLGVEARIDPLQLAQA